jgi:hypothetical protein
MNCHLQHVIEGKNERIGRRERGRKQLLDEIKEAKKNTRNWKRKHYVALCGEIALEKAMDMTYDTTEWMNEWVNEWMNVQINKWINPGGSSK